MRTFLNSSIVCVHVKSEIKIHFYGWFIKISVGSLSLDCVVIDFVIHLRAGMESKNNGPKKKTHSIG